MNSLKKINFAEKTFTANGKTYFIETTLSYDRWKEWRKLQVEISYDVSFDNLFEKLKDTWALLNQPTPKVLDAGVTLYNVMQGMKMAMDDKQIPLVIQMCALFMNVEDEDRRFITKEQIATKANDWKEEGIDMESFFTFAISSIPNFLKSYESIIQDISQLK